MNLTKHIIVLLIIFLTFAFNEPLIHSQTKSNDKSNSKISLTDLLKQHSYELKLENGDLSGSGRDFLISAAQGTQFFTIGEPHNTKEVPEITALIYKLLHEKYGYNYIALEQDPITARMISARSVVGKRDYVIQTAKKYPNAFTFNLEESNSLDEPSFKQEIPNSKQTTVTQFDGDCHKLTIYSDKVSVKDENGKRIYTHTGNVDIRFGNIQLKTSQIDYITSIKNTGKTTSNINPSIIEVESPKSKTQTTDKPSFGKEFSKMWQRHKRYTLDLAEAMPEEYFNFKPTSEVRSFAEILLHIASSNYGFSMITKGENGPSQFTVGGKSKKEILEILADSFDFGDETVKRISENELSETVPWANRLEPSTTRTKRDVFQVMREHAAHHRGALTVYLRLKGITPPAYVD
ncbi:MAG: DinB family protein [Pyrinomonadaceae bacterium]